MSTPKPRASGITVIGDVPWGTHFCLFYRTAQDLADLLVPYFKAGLESNEACMWVTSEPLPSAAARAAISRSVQGIDRYLASGQLRILTHREWYLKGGSFDLQRVLDGWCEELERARSAGFDGLRVTDNTAWLEKQDWDGFTQYEAAINGMIGGRPMIALCTYAMDRCGAAEVVDVVHNHEFALINEGGRWELIESALSRRTRQPLQASEVRYRNLVERLEEGVWALDREGNTTFVNRRMARMLGQEAQAVLGRSIGAFLGGPDAERVLGLLRPRAGTPVGPQEPVDVDLLRPDGARTPALLTLSVVHDDAGAATGFIATVLDVTERRRSDALLTYQAGLIDAVSDVIYSTDAQFRIRSWNQAAARTYGWSAAEAAGSELHDLLKIEYVGTSRGEALARLFADGKWEGDLIHHLRDGAPMRVRVSRTVMRNPSGEVTGIAFVARDVTDRRRAQQALQETRDYLENLINYANAPIIVWDADLAITRFNHAFERLTGRIAAEVIGQGLEILFPDETREASLARIRSAMAGERWEAVEIPILRKDGGVRVVLWNSATIHGSDGRTVVATIAQGQDITERIQAEQALRETRDYLENLIEHANAPIIVWNSRMRITRFNRAFERLTGRAATEAVGQSLEILFPDESREPSLARIRGAMSGERWEAVEIPILRADGGVRIVLWNSATIHGPDGRSVVATMAQGQDITERIHAEAETRRLLAEVRQEKDRLASLVSSINDEVWFADAHKQFTLVNPTAAREFALREGIVDVQQLAASLEVFRPDGSPRPVEEAPPLRALAGEIVRNQEEMIQTPARGEIRYRQVSAAPVRDEQGAIIGSVSVMRDITELRRAEEALQRRTEEVARSNRELEQFAYVASHDLQEPLRMVSSYVQLLAERYRGRLDADADEFIRFARDGALRMQRLINDLLTYSRLGTRGVVPRDTDAGAALAAALQNLRLAIEESGASVTHDPLPMVLADPGQLIQLLQNLVDNGLKFHGEAPPRIHVGCRADGGQWVISVRDNGIGIAEEYFEKIFVIFQRLHPRSAYPGTGIGLAICKRIVERLGGSIWVESKPGEGTTFFFTLPAATGKEHER